MSSHREAPEISKDPVADSTDLYAFVSPDAPNTVTIIANYVPLQGPAGGPNFYEFGDDVLYEINIDNDNDGDVDITFQFQFTTRDRGRRHVPLQRRPDHVAQLDHVEPAPVLFGHPHRLGAGRSTTAAPSRSPRRPGITQLASNLPCPPCNVGPRSTPNYDALAGAAVQTLSDGTKVFAGQRAEGFYVDLGSIFDLGALRPIQSAHLIPIPGQRGRGATRPRTSTCTRSRCRSR